MSNKTERELLVEAIQKHGSTIHAGKVFTKENMHELPSEADMAAGDEEKSAAARERIEAQIAVLKDELKKLDAPKAAAPEKVEPKAEPKVDAKAEAKSDAKK